MTDSLLHLIRRLRQSAAGADTGPPADELLLERYVRTRDEPSFEVLVWRHGGLVLGAARRLLGDGPDAEDAFQAAFLTLARKAAAIRSGRCLAAWLHLVTCRIALRLAQQRAARRRVERQLDGRDFAADGPRPADDLGPVLDTEIARLPERLRRVVVLCYLEGRTAEAAAAELGCPRGTVLSRLASARKLLRRRLEHRGVAPAAVVALSASAAAVPGELVAAAVTLARFGGAAAIPAPIRSLSEGVIRAMFWNKCRIPLAAAILACACLISVGITRADKPSPTPGDPPPVPRGEKPGPANADAAKLEALLKERRDNLRKGYNMLKNRGDLLPLSSTLEQILCFQEELLETELDLSANPRQRVEAHERALVEARDLLKVMEDRVKGGLSEPHDLTRTKDKVLKFEIGLLREKMKQAGK